MPNQKTKSVDPFEDMNKNSSGVTGLEGIIFDNNQSNKQKPEQKYDDIFGSGMLMPESNNTNKMPSSNPFDAFATPGTAATQQSNPFVSDVFSQNNAFPTSFDNQFSSGFGMGQSDWGSGFSNQFSGGNFTSNSAFTSSSNTFGSKPAPKQNSDFAALNPFGGAGKDQPKVAATNNRPSNAALPPGVSGFDLFQ